LDLVEYRFLIHSFEDMSHVTMVVA